MDLFDHPETWFILHRKILSGYAADALEALWLGKKGAMQSEEVVGFWKSVVSALDSATAKQAPVGLGEHFLLEGDLKGFALVHNGSIRHLFAFQRKSVRW